MMFTEKWCYMYVELVAEDTSQRTGRAAAALTTDCRRRSSAMQSTLRLTDQHRVAVIKLAESTSARISVITASRDSEDRAYLLPAAARSNSGADVWNHGDVSIQVDADVANASSWSGDTHLSADTHCNLL